MEGLEFILLFPSDLLVDPIFVFSVIFRDFLVDFLGKVLEVFLCGIFVGITHEVGVPIFLVTLLLKLNDRTGNQRGGRE
jgi:hypothetical protein